jgi:hypothetical protein
VELALSGAEGVGMTKDRKCRNSRDRLPAGQDDSLEGLSHHQTRAGMTNTGDNHEQRSK